MYRKKKSPRHAQAILPARLLDAVRLRRLIPFVGAGMSRQSDPNRYPAWGELLVRMIKKFNDEKFLSGEEAESLEDMVRVGNNPQAVAETLRARAPRDAYYAFLQEQFSYIPETPSGAHIALLRLEPAVIVTTNYDKLIENAYAHETGKALSVVSYTQPAQVRNKLLDAVQSKSPFLFKLHGDIDCPSEIILAGSDYEKLKQFNDGYRLLLSSLFFHYTTLFIGFSLADAEIMIHIRNVQEALRGERYPDYALLSQTSCSDREVNEFRKEFGIQVIRYGKGGKNHAGLPKLLYQLANQMED